MPTEYDYPIAGDGGLLCCKRFYGARSQLDLQLYVCNPLTQAWRKPPIPSLLTELKIVYMVTNKQTKQYTTTVIDVSCNKGEKAVVEVFDSSASTWTAGGGNFASDCSLVNNLVYYIAYENNAMGGLKAYDKKSGLTTTVVVPVDIYEQYLCRYPLCEYQGRIFAVRTQRTLSGIWILQGPNCEWQWVCTVSDLHANMRFYLFSLYVMADFVVIQGEFKRTYVVEGAEGDEEDAYEEHEYEPYNWMYIGFQNMWHNMGYTDALGAYEDVSKVMFEAKIGWNTLKAGVPPSKYSYLLTK